VLKILKIFPCIADLVSKYGARESYVMNCPQCSHPVEMITSGIHFGDSGSVRIYSDVDPFECPKCSYKESTTPGMY